MKRIDISGGCLMGGREAIRVKKERENKKGAERKDLHKVVNLDVRSWFRPARSAGDMWSDLALLSALGSRVERTLQRQVQKRTSGGKCVSFSSAHLPDAKSNTMIASFNSCEAKGG
jgi:hypothetical protein